jgi:hypothetical protein
MTHLGDHEEWMTNMTISSSAKNLRTLICPQAIHYSKWSLVASTCRILETEKQE